MEKKKRERRADAALFALYLLGLLLLLFWREKRGEPGFNLMPLRSVKVYCRILFTPGWSEELRRYAWINFLGNLLLFVPLGVFLPRLLPPLRRFALFAAAVCAFLIIIEGLQFLTARGSMDIDDLILNLLGACAGFALRRGGKE